MVRLLARYEITTPSARAALAATELAARHSVSIWDAFIVQAAIEAGCDTLFSEDLQAGRRFGPVTVVNPFDLSAHEPQGAYRAAPAAKARRKPSGTKARAA